MARMRSIQEAYQLMKADDPGTAVTVSMLRRFVAESRVPSIRIGRKILLNYDALTAYLAGTPADLSSAQEEAPVIGAIRPVPVDLK